MANLNASDNPFPSILLEEHVDPSTPASGHWRLFMDTDNVLKLIDDTGTVNPVASTGNVATDAVWDAAGDLVQGTGANTAAKLGAGTAGMFLKSAGAAAANLWAFPPGYELDYVQKTTNTTITATTENTADTIVTGASVAYDGSTIVILDWYASQARPATGGGTLNVWLYDGSASIGKIAHITGGSGVASNMYGRLRFTPSNASHTYSVRASTDAGSGLVVAGSGVITANWPTFMRIVKV